MSRKSKPRKPHNLPITLALRCIDRIMFACSTVTPLRPYGGRGYHQFTTPEIRISADEYVIQHLFRIDHVWRGWACRVVRDGDKYVVDSRQFSFDNYNLGDLVDYGDSAYSTFFETVPNLVGWALVITPGKAYDFTANSLALEQHYLEEITSKEPSPLNMFSNRRDIFGELITANALQHKNKTSGLFTMFKETDA